MTSSLVAIDERWASERDVIVLMEVLHFQIRSYRYIFEITVVEIDTGVSYKFVPPPPLPRIPP